MEINLRPKKRLFIGMLTLAVLAVALVCGLIWRIGYLGLNDIHPLLPWLTGGFMVITVGLMLLGIFNMVLAVKGWPYLSLCQKQIYQLVNLLFPLVLLLGKPLGIGRRELEGSFIAVSNQLFRRRNIKVEPERLLVLTPHCLQLASCPRKITRDPNNCKRCGGCNIGDLLNLADEIGFRFFVATGGTLARQVAKEWRPKAVLAVACERDLMSGIQDVYPLPAVGVLNIRPNGPCYNTKVDMEEVRAAVNAVIIPKRGDS